MRTVHVDIDTREDDVVILDLAEEFEKNSEVEDWHSKQLEAGDIAIGSIGFERKTMSDYASTMLEGRLEEQAAKMSQHYEHGYFLLEGDLVQTANPLGGVTSNISPEALRGSMASLIARWGLPVIPCSNRALLADMAVRIARKHIESSEDNWVPRGTVTGRDAPVALKMYGCIPKVGGERAHTLYEEFPTLQEFVNTATVERIAGLDGFGEKTAKTVMEAIK